MYNMEFPYYLTYFIEMCILRNHTCLCNSPRLHKQGCGEEARHLTTIIESHGKFKLVYEKVFKL